MLLATEQPNVGSKYRLAHRAEQLLDPRVAIRVNRSLSREEVGRALRDRGAPEACCVFVDRDMAPRVMTLDEALTDLVFGDDAAIISCVPGTLGLFSDEAPGDQWLLVARD